MEFDIKRVPRYYRQLHLKVAALCFVLLDYYIHIHIMSNNYVLSRLSVSPRPICRPSFKLSKIQKEAHDIFLPYYANYIPQILCWITFM